MSQLSRLAKILSAANIDISHLVALTEYLEDENVVAMLETAISVTLLTSQFPIG